MAAPPKLRSDLITVPSTVDQATVYTIKDPITGKYFRLREPEFWLISQFDGQSEADELAKRFREQFDANIAADQVNQFVTILEDLLFLENTHSEQGISRQAYRNQMARSRLSQLLYMPLTSFAPGRILDVAVRLYRPLHSRLWFAVSLLGLILAAWVLGENRSSFAIDPRTLISWNTLITLVAAIFIMGVFHEMAHAVVCRYYGGDVRRMGFFLLYFQPCFYCDISDAWLFPKRSQRLLVTLAGPYCQALLTGAAILLWRITQPETWINSLVWMTALISLVTLLFNLNPLIKLDGYYLLSDWMEVPNLRQKAFRYLGNVFKRWALGWPIERIDVTARERRIFLIYAVLALIYSAFLIGYSAMFLGRLVFLYLGGAGLLLLIGVVLFMLRRELGRLAKGILRHLGYMKTLLAHPIRLTVYIILTIALIVVCFIVKFPHRVAGEVTVAPLREFSVGINQLGYLESTYRQGGEHPENKSWLTKMESSDVLAIELKPMVNDGQHVKAGDTIAIAVSNLMAKDLESSEAELQRLEGELALLKAPPKRERVEEARALVNSARTALDQRQREYKRVQQLVDRKLGTQEQLEGAKSAVDIAEAEMANRKSTLALVESPPRPEEEAVLQHAIAKQQSQIQYLRSQAAAQIIAAPIDGTVRSRLIDTKLLVIADGATIEAQVPVTDIDIPLVSLRQKVSLKVRAYPSMVFEGEVAALPEVGVEKDKQMIFPVTATFKNGSALLQQGMSGYAKIEVGTATLAARLWRKLRSLIRVEFWSWW